MMRAGISALFLLVIASLCPMALAHGETHGDLDHNTRKITRMENGKVEVAGTVYDTRLDYYQSEHFHRFGQRCGTRHTNNSMPRGGAQGDCDAFGTSILPTYQPSMGRVGIPVVVHVIQATNGEGNVPISEIEAQIEILNDAFLARSGSHAAVSANAEIEFYLADTDPGGNPTNGITRTIDDDWFVENGPYWETLAWNPSRYMNIYTLDLDPQGLLGYVEALPAEAPIVGQTADRVVVHFGSFGGMGSDGPPYDLGRTLIHEVGHYLGLYHVWGTDFSCSNEVSPGCYSTGDFLCDTEPQDFERYGCDQTSSCGSEDPIFNYMNYSDDICLLEFTPEQVNRMRCTLANYRSSLATAAPGALELEVTPATPVSHSGLAGGPFTTPLSAWTVRKVGTGVVDYNVTIRDNFGLLLNSGTNDIAGSFANSPNQLRTFQITHAADLVDLPAGNYSAQVVFQNLTTGTEVVRLHQLEVGSFSADYTGSPTAIPDGPLTPQVPNPGLTSQFIVNQEGIIEDLNINIELLHSWIGDLTVTLTHVNTGSSAILLNRIGGVNCDANNVNITLDDDGAGGQIQTQCQDNLASPPAYQPSNPLAPFNGEAIAGVWRLTIVDGEPFDTGTLITWGLRARITADVDDGPGPVDDGPPATPQLDSDGDGLADAFDNCIDRANDDQADINVNGIGDACETTVGLGPCPETIMVQASDGTGAIVNFDLPVAAGGFGDITVMATPPPGTRFAVGTRTVEVLAFNNNGSSDSCNFEVTVTAPAGPPPPSPMMGGICGVGMIEMALLPMAALLATRRVRRRS